MTKTVVKVVLGLTLVGLGIALSVYAEADDSPGGVLIGAALAAGGLALGIKAMVARG